MVEFYWQLPCVSKIGQGLKIKMKITGCNLITITDGFGLSIKNAVEQVGYYIGPTSF